MICSSVASSENASPKELKRKLLAWHADTLWLKRVKPEKGWVRPRKRGG